MKTRPMGVKFYADRQTDMTKLIVALRSFANAPKNRSKVTDGWHAVVVQKTSC
jgi:hypothetical protein